MTESERNALVLKTWGIVKKISRRYWRFVPFQVRVWYSEADLEIDVLVRVLELLPRWDPARGSVSTLTYWIANSECLRILQKFSAKKRQVRLDSFDDGREIAVSDVGGLSMDAVSEVEALLQEAGDDLRKALATVYGERTTSFSLEAARGQLLLLKTRLRVSFEDARTVMDYLSA